MAEAVYLLCAVTSVVCAGLLLRSFVTSHLALILWTSVCFIGLAVNNVLLFFDLVVYPTGPDLSVWRNGFALGGAAILLFGMIWAEPS